MNLVSMKTDASPEPMPESAYGYGLRIYLNDDQCEALGIKGPITAGSSFVIEALAVVVRCTESTELDGDDKGNDISLDLQITDMAIGGTKKEPNPATLYGETT